jgi:hypothetical protein
MKLKLEGQELALPDFIIIGAQKAGTASMYHVLKHHPEVQMSSKKEVSFFNIEVRFQKGLPFYSSYFAHAEPGKVLGEATPNYLLCPKTPKRIAEALPQAKLIASLRNPVHRAFSAWRMDISTGSETRPFAEAVRRVPGYIENGRYHQQLSRYLDSFPRGQFLILLFEDLKASPDRFYEEIFSFIGVEPRGVDPSVFGINPNIGGTPKWSTVTAMLNAGFRARNAIRQTPLKGVVDNPWLYECGRWIRNKITKWNRKPEVRHPKIDSETASYIIELLADDISNLSRLLDRNLQHWMTIEPSA